MVNVVAAAVPVVFFVAAIVSYCVHGALRDTDNQFVDPTPGTYAFMIALIVGEIGAVVLIAGVVARSALPGRCGPSRSHTRPSRSGVGVRPCSQFTTSSSTTSCL